MTFGCPLNSNIFNANAQQILQPNEYNQEKENNDE